MKKIITQAYVYNKNETSLKYFSNQNTIYKINKSYKEIPIKIENYQKNKNNLNISKIIRYIYFIKKIL